MNVGALNLSEMSLKCIDINPREDVRAKLSKESFVTLPSGNGRPPFGRNPASRVEGRSHVGTIIHSHQLNKINQNEMILKKTRWCYFLKPKVCLTIISFIAGYLCHWLLSTDDGRHIATIPHHSIAHANADVVLVALIFSSVDNLSKRNTIRETWLSDRPENDDMKYYFAISLGNAGDSQKKEIAEEQRKHGDLLIFPNLEDSFYSLTAKLVACFGWLTDIPVLREEGESENQKPFSDFRFLLKCDDDSFVRVPEILQELKTSYSGPSGDNLYWGFFDGRASPKKGGKYKEEQWNICDYFIPYALGGGYILARPLVAFMARNGDQVKKYRSEDVSVGAWLSSYAGLKRVHDPRFDTEYISRGCHQSYLITHKHSEAAMRNFYENLRSTGHLCRKEFKTRMSYIYNWDVVPSKCCARLNPNIP